MSENKHNEEIVTSQNPETSNVQPSSDSNDENQQPENSSSTQDETENQDNAPIELDVPLVNPAESDFNLEEDPEELQCLLPFFFQMLSFPRPYLLKSNNQIFYKSSHNSLYASTSFAIIFSR